MEEKETTEEVLKSIQTGNTIKIVFNDYGQKEFGLAPEEIVQTLFVTTEEAGCRTKELIISGWLKPKMLEFSLRVNDDRVRCIYV